MNKHRDYYEVPKDLGYFIVIERRDRKPYAVYEKYYGGYRNGFQTQIRGRYETPEQAKRRVRYLENND